MSPKNLQGLGLKVPDVNRKQLLVVLEDFLGGGLHPHILKLEIIHLTLMFEEISWNQMSGEIGMRLLKIFPPNVRKSECIIPWI